MIVNSTLAMIPVLAYSSGRGANLCVSCLYSHACLHTQFHLGLFWRPVKTQASGTNSVCKKKKKCPCMFNYNRTLSLSLRRVRSIELSSERRCLLATMHYCRFFEVWQEEKVLIFKVLATIPSDTHTHIYTHPVKLNPVPIWDFLGEVWIDTIFGFKYILSNPHSRMDPNTTYHTRI